MFESLNNYFSKNTIDLESDYSGDSLFADFDSFEIGIQGRVPNQNNVINRPLPIPPFNGGGSAEAKSISI